MSVFVAGIAVAIAFALLHFLVIPLLERRCRSDHQRSVIERAAVLSMFYVARSALSMAVLVAVLASALVVGLDFFPATDDAAALRAFAGFLDPWRARLLWLPYAPFLALGALTTAILALAAYGATRKRVRETFEASEEQERARLQTAIAGGSLEDLAPTPEMKQIESTLAETLRVLDRVETLDLPEEAKAEQIKKLEERSAELIAERERADLARRLTVSLDADIMIVPPPRSFFERLLPLWMRRGPLSALRTKRRLLLICCLLVLLLAELLVMARPLGTAVDARIVALNTQQILAREKKALEELRKKGDPVPSDEAWGEGDELVVNHVARVFEQSLGTFLMGPAIRTAEEARVRERLLLGFALVGAGRGLSVRSVFEGASDLRPIELEAVALQLAAREHAGPGTNVGIRLKKDAREQMKKEPAAWRHIRESIESGDHTLADEATGAEIGPLAAAEVFGAAMLGKQLPSPELGKVVEALTKDVGAKNLERVYFLKASGFRAALVEGRSLSDAAAEVAGPLLLTRDPAYAPLTTNLAALPKADALPRGIVNHPAALLSSSSGENVDPQALHNALDAVIKVAAYGEKDAALNEVVASLAEFDDWAPAQRGLEQKTLRAKTLAEQKATILDPGISTRARDAQRFLSFGPAAGFVAGTRGGAGPSPNVSELDWTTRRDRIALSLKTKGGGSFELGSYRQALVWLALAYAADGRAPLVLTTPGRFIGADKRLLNPALQDTVFGCRIAAVQAELDALVRAATLDQPAILDALSDAASYELAWAIRTRLIDQSHVLRAREEERPSRPAWIRLSAETRAVDPDVRARVERTLRDPTHIKTRETSILRRLPAHFDPGLVDLVEECATSETLAEFEGCIARGTRRWLTEIENGGGEGWWRPPPRLRVRVNVSEGSWSPDAAFQFLTKPADGDYESLKKVLRFRVEMAPLSPSSKTSVDEDATYASGAVEIPEVSALVQRSVHEALVTDPFRRMIFVDTVEFILLQRLVRTALDGELGAEMPLDRLLELAAEVAGRRPPSAHIPRFDAPSVDAERRYLGAVQGAIADLEHRPGERPDWINAALGAMRGCRTELDKLSDAELLALPEEAFAERCKSPPPPPPYPSGPFADAAPLVRAMTRNTDLLRGARALRRLLLLEHAEAPVSLGNCPRL
ncbi:MAG: hypothetical protein U1E65_04255 [Myxococcota bacterium]